MRKNKINKQEQDILEKKIQSTEPKDNLYCYLRVSTQEQNDKNHSIDRQRTFGKKVSKKLGLNYVEMNEGGTSSVNRKDDTKFKLLQRLIREGKVKHLWYYNRSRWTRTQEEDIVIKRTLLEKFRVKVYEGENGKLRNTSEPTDDFLDNILSSVQELDRLSRRQTSISGKKHVSQKYGKTKCIHLGGSVPFGCQVVDKEVVPHPENSKHLKKMYEMYSQGISTRKIKLYLETNGIKTGRGNSKWSLRSIELILKNERYKGYWKWEDKDSGDIHPMISPRLIGESLFNKVQKRLDRNRKHRGDNTRKHDSLFGQKMICGCGTRFVTHHMKRNDSKQGEYFSKSYYCWSKQKQWKGELGIVCNNRRSLEMDLTDKFLLKHIEDVVRHSHKFKEDFKNNILGNKKLTDETLNSKKLLIQKRIDRTVQQLSSVHETISQIHLEKTLGKKSKSLCEKMIDTFEKESIKLEDEKNNSIQEIKDLDNLSEWVEWVDLYGEHITQRISDRTKSMEMVQELIDKITVSEVIGKDRDEKNIQIGHRFEILFKLPIVNDKLIYKDEKNKSKGYDIKSGRRLSKTTTFKGFTESGKHRTGYERKKKDKKTQETQYVETDEHPVQTNEISHSRMSSFEQDGYVLSGSIPYLCFTTVIQSNDLTYLQEYSVRQNIIYKLIRYLHQEKGMGYRKISTWLNRSGIKSERGKKFSNGSVHSVLKRKKEREMRIRNVRQRKFDFILKDMRIEYKNHS